MLLSDWYTQWKEKRIQAAVEAAKAKGYEEGYADGRSGTPNITGTTVTRSSRSDEVSRESSKGDILTHPKRSK